jgi:hypothetical protein
MYDEPECAEENSSEPILIERLAKSPDRTPSQIEQQVLGVSVHSTVDELAAAIDAAEWLICRAKSIQQIMRQIAIAWIDRNGEFDIGEQHYCVGFSIGFKCVNVPQTGHAVLDSVGGDFDQFLSVLVAQPFKHATVRNVIGKKLHDSYFMAHRTGRLINGVPERI